MRYDPSSDCNTQEGVSKGEFRGKKFKQGSGCNSTSSARRGALNCSFFWFSAVGKITSTGNREQGEIMDRVQPGAHDLSQLLPLSVLVGTLLIGSDTKWSIEH